MSKAWAKGSTTAWRKLRAAILLQNEMTNGGKCGLQLEGCTGTANQVHHIYGKEHGDDPSGLMAVCAHCNYKYGSPSKHRDPKGKPADYWD